MKRIITLLTICSLSLLATDFSVDTSQNNSVNIDKSNSEKEGMEQRTNLSKRASTTKSKDKTDTESYELTKIEQTEILDKIMDFEESGIYPFSACKLLTNPKLLPDFGITSETEDGYIDSYKADLLDKAAKNSFALKRVRAKEKLVKDYINCGAFYGGIIAQAMKTGQIDTDITNKEIKRTYKKVQRFLGRTHCRFDKSLENIACGPLKLSVGYEPQIFYSNISLFNNQTFYGYSANERKTVSYSNRLAQEVSKTKERSTGTSLSKDVTRNWKKGVGVESSAKTSFSPRNWIKFE